jgi:hypothetical protein
VPKTNSRGKANEKAFPESEHSSLTADAERDAVPYSASSADLKNNRLQHKLESERFGSSITDELV